MYVSSSYLSVLVRCVVELIDFCCFRPDSVLVARLSPSGAVKKVPQWNYNQILDAHTPATVGPNKHSNAKEKTNERVSPVHGRLDTPHLPSSVSVTVGSALGDSTDSHLTVPFSSANGGTQQRQTKYTTKLVKKVCMVTRSHAICLSIIVLQSLFG